jgi:hypothetical protein
MRLVIRDAIKKFDIDGHIDESIGKHPLLSLTERKQTFFFSFARVVTMVYAYQQAYSVCRVAPPPNM